MSQIFISYAKEDRVVAQQLYQELTDNGFTAWLDVVDLRPGQEWELEIKKAIRESPIFLACLSTHAVSKRGFVQSELNSAMKIIDTVPEGSVYLIPVRLDLCDVPTKLEHLQWVDYFADGGSEKLIDALREYLGHSISPRARAASGPLRFSSIGIDASDPNWAEGERGDSPFDYPPSQHFQLVKFVHSADPLFDITLMNPTSSPVILTAIGVEILKVAQVSYLYGIPSAAKITKSDSYVLECPNIRERLKAQRGWDYGPEDIQERITKRIADPIYLEPKAPYRYGLLLKNYYKHVPNWARIGMCASTDHGECQSAELGTFTL